MKINYFLILIFIWTSCSMNKDLLETVKKENSKHIVFPPDYYQHLPDTTLLLWDKDYQAYNKFVTRNVARTQLGMSFVKDGVSYWTIYPSARPHVQLDSITRISRKEKIEGNWRSVANRTILFSDSGNIKKDFFIRSYKVIKNDSINDVVVSIEPERIKYYSSKGDQKYKRIASMNYLIENERYLLQYGYTLSSASTSIIGLTKENYLIISNYQVTERKKESEYITYETTMNQLILERISEIENN